MDAESLLKWKQKMFHYQQTVRKQKPQQQVTLFDTHAMHVDPDSIDPFSLRLRPLSFWRLPVDSPGEACLYFVIDNALPLLLYVGESCRSNQRWKGIHDCKRYIENYQSLHYQHQMKTAVCIAFWWNTPTQTAARQRLESALIAKWRSANAKSRKIGFWNQANPILPADFRRGKRANSLAKPSTTRIQPQTNSLPTGDYSCSDFKTQAQAQAEIRANPQLDRDKDGIACESLL